MDVVSRIAEERIVEAMARGEFDRLPGRGRPLPKDELAGLPDDVRVGYRILKNSGVLPPEVELHRETARLKHLIRACLNEESRRRLRRRLAEQVLRLNLLQGK